MWGRGHDWNGLGQATMRSFFENDGDRSGLRGPETLWLAWDSAKVNLRLSVCTQYEGTSAVEWQFCAILTINFDTRCRWAVSVTTGLFFPRAGHPYLGNRRLRESQSLSGHCREDKSLLLPGIEIRSTDKLSHYTDYAIPAQWDTRLCPVRENNSQHKIKTHKSLTQLLMLNFVQECLVLLRTELSYFFVCFWKQQKILIFAATVSRRKMLLPIGAFCPSWVTMRKVKMAAHSHLASE